MMKQSALAVIFCLLFRGAINAFYATPARVTRPVNGRQQQQQQRQHKQGEEDFTQRPIAMTSSKEHHDDTSRKVTNTAADLSRRNTFQIAVASLMLGSIPPPVAMAAQRTPLSDCLYRILRVREATMQEARLIQNGKFKDVQRNNVKLAIRFMIENYRLNDAFVAASSYLPSDTKVTAAEVGQAAVSNLYTILEYFDSGDVENIKVTSLGGGKEELVLKGLDSTKRKIDDFVAYFPKNDVDEVASRIADENRLNEKEFDPEIGKIINLPTV